MQKRYFLARSSLSNFGWWAVNSVAWTMDEVDQHIGDDWNRFRWRRWIVDAGGMIICDDTLVARSPSGELIWKSKDIPTTPKPAETAGPDNLTSEEILSAILDGDFDDVKDEHGLEDLGIEFRGLSLHMNGYHVILDAGPAGRIEGHIMAANGRKWRFGIDISEPTLCE